MTDYLLQSYHRFSSFELILILFNFLVIIGGKTFFRLFLRTLGLHDILVREEQNSRIFQTFRRLNLLVLILIIIQTGRVGLPLEDNLWVSHLLMVFLIGSASYFIDVFMDIIIRIQFGKKRTFDGKTEFQDTYRSRLLSLIATGFIFILALVLSIRVLGFESLLETGGMLGIIGVFLALTQGSWAPDLIGGLIVLNSGLIEEGDVVELPSQKLLGVVFKTKMFHTEFLSLSNNHRIMLANSQLRQVAIHNLSKFASAKGLRESLSFKIGYDTPVSRINQLFQTSFDEVVADSTLEILGQYPLEIRVDDAGDYAVKWTIFYYIKDLKKLLAIRQGFCKHIVINSSKFGVSLATPILYQKVEETSDTPFITPVPSLAETGGKTSK